MCRSRGGRGLGLGCRSGRSSRSSGFRGRLRRCRGLCRGRGLRRSRGGGLCCRGGGLLGRLALGLLFGLALCLFLGLPLGAGLRLDARPLFRLFTRSVLLGAEHGVPLLHDLADRLGDQRARADRIVVAGNHEIDPVRVAVGVDQADDRDPQAASLFDGDLLGLQVDHEHRVGHALHVLDAAEVRPQLRQIGLRGHPLARRQQRELTVGLVAFEVVQAADALADRLEVREQTAKPAVVDERHPGGFGDILDRVARLLLGADEQHRPAAVGERAGELLRLVERRGGLEQIDDVDAAALTMDETAHLGVPAAGLVAEVDAGLQQLRDAYLSHEVLPLFVRLVAVRERRTRRATKKVGRRAGPRS